MDVYIDVKLILTIEQLKHIDIRKEVLFMHLLMLVKIKKSVYRNLQKSIYIVSMKQMVRMRLFPNRIWNS